MRIFVYKDRGVDITPLKRMMARVMEIEWVEEEVDLSNLPWETYRYSKPALGIKKSWIADEARKVYDKHETHIDIVMHVVNDHNWRDTPQQIIWGWHVGSPYHTYQTVQVRVHGKGWEETGYHEIMHTLDNIIYIETGVKIAPLLGVKDFDEDIVHITPRSRRVRVYNETIEKIKVFIDQAIRVRRKTYIQSLLQTALRLARLRLVQLQAKVTPVPPESTEKPLQPIVAQKAEQLIALASLHGLDLRITEGYRSIERQNELYEQGRTTPGNIVTNAKGGESYHNFAVSFDVVDRKKGYDINWELVGKIGKTLGLEWGGDWTSFPDRPHFQYTAGYSLKDFQSGQVDYKKFNTETYA